jgi:ribosomal protein S14
MKNEYFYFLLKFVVVSQYLSISERARAQLLLHNLRTNTQRARARTRCVRTGRARGVLRVSQCSRLETALLIRSGQLASYARYLFFWCSGSTHA